MKRATLVMFASLTLASCSVVHRQASSTTGAANEHADVVSDVSDAGLPDATTILETDETVTGEPIRYPASRAPQIVSSIVTIAPGQSTGWHRHSVPTYGHILSGTLEVEYEKSGRRELHAGDSLMESMRESHNAVNVGREPVRILAVFMGAQGKPNVMNTDPPSMPAGLGGTRASDLVDLRTVDPSLRFDIRYATRENFTGDVVYPVAQPMMQRPAADALRRANRRANDKGYGLVVFDAYRPWSVTRMFWDRFPMHRAYLADPLAGSRHNRGCAVDLSLVDLASGREVKMPSTYDEFSEKAHPSYAGGSAAERASRDLLRTFMEAEGFSVYENEWWHFDYTGWQEWPVLDVPLGQSTSHAS